MQCEKNKDVKLSNSFISRLHTRNYYYHHELEFSQAALSCQHGGWPFLLR